MKKFVPLPSQKHNISLITEDSFNDKSNPHTFPPVCNSLSGVSVEYVPAPQQRRVWYVFRIKYHKEIFVADELISRGVYAYVATKVVEKYKDGEVSVSTVPLVNLVFAYLSFEEAQSFVSGPGHIPYLTFYYNHFESGENFRNPPLTVPESEILNFILATQSHNKHLRVLSYDDVKDRMGAKVLVRFGEFSGVEGRLIRLAGQQRVLIKMLGSTLIATAYVPTAFLGFIEDE